MAEYGFFFDNSRCTGCRTCVMACKDYNDTSPDVSYRKVYDVEGGTCIEGDDGTVSSDAFVYHLSLGCQHCDDPACMKACPTMAMHKDPGTQLVLVDEARCIGCGYCVMACPYNAPKVDRALGHSVKCTGCIERVQGGLPPICVDACPLRALDFGEMDALRERHEGTARLHPMPDASITGPHIVIKPSPAAESDLAASGVVANPKEVR